MKIALPSLAAVVVALLSGSGTNAEAPVARVGVDEGNSSRHVDSHLRGGAWTFHVNDPAPCGFFTTRPMDALGRPTECVFRDGTTPRDVDAPSHIARVFSPFEDPSTALGGRRVTFSLSKEVIEQLDTIDVDFTTVGFAPGVADWIGVYCFDSRAGNPAIDREYIDWQWVNASTPIKTETDADSSALGRSKTWRLTFGPMVNFRCDWQFRYFQTIGSAQYNKLGASSVVRFAKGDTEPLQVRLAMTGEPSEMRVMWVSGAVDDAHVQFGSDPKKLTSRVKATGSTYTAADICQAPANIEAAQAFRDPGMIYEAVITGLVPGKSYYYRVGSDKHGMTRVFRMIVPPAPGQHPKGSVMSFFMYADLGEWTTAATGLSPPVRSGTTMELVRRELDRSDRNYVAVLHDGDISYARGIAFQWDQFGALVQPVASEIPYMVSMGNHGEFYQHVFALVSCDWC
ncbi:hypothetical protein PINS_up005501 [Pythium insidiosum]|nr:hypothetical protein PINS_up005501 [Pythium insidiosum]